jgi:hypothetical protein
MSKVELQTFDLQLSTFDRIDVSPRSEKAASEIECERGGTHSFVLLIRGLEMPEKTGAADFRP